MRSNFKKILPCAIILLVLPSCKIGPLENISTGEFSGGLTSSCGGFKALEKKTSLQQRNIQDDDSMYCSAEKLSWVYDNGAQILVLIHERFMENCCAAISASGEILGDTIDLAENVDATNPCDCDCPFDVATKFTGMERRKFTVVLHDRSYTVDLNKPSGVIVLDTAEISGCTSQRKYGM